MFARSRYRAGSAALASLALAAGALGAVGLSVASAPAVGAATTTTGKCPTPEILGGIKATGATVTTPGAQPRTLDQDQATAFMQTWLAFSVFESPPQERPPAGVPVSTLEVATSQSGQPGQLTIFYATDGTSVWVGAPAPPPVPAPPNDQKWIRAPKPKETTEAFAGDLAPICTDPATGPSTSAPTATTVAAAAKPDGNSSDDGTPWALIIIGLVVVVGGGAVLALRSRHKPASA